MKIDVTAGEAVDAQVCRYAEYKLFSALATLSLEIQRVSIELTARSPGTGVEVCCEIVLAGRRPRVVVRAQASAASRAVDVAARRAARDVARRAADARGAQRPGRVFGGPYAEQDTPRRGAAAIRPRRATPARDQRR